VKKRFFKFTEKEPKANDVAGVLSGTHGIDEMVAAMRATGYIVEEITAKRAARIRQQQRRKEAAQERIRQALEVA